MSRQARGSLMALYAAFLALVALPLLLLSVDVSRFLVRRTQLANALEAACTAFVNTPDLEAMRGENKLKLDSDAAAQGSLVFLHNAYGSPGVMRLTQMSYRTTPVDFPNQVIIATCAGEADFQPMMLGGRVTYWVRASTDVKAKPGAADNWR